MIFHTDGGSCTRLPRLVPRLAMTGGVGALSCHCDESLCRVGTCPHRCRNYQLRTSLFMPAVCRFADGWDMSQPYIGCFVYHGAFSRMDCEGACARGNLAGTYNPIPPHCTQKRGNRANRPISVKIPVIRQYFNEIHQSLCAASKRGGNAQAACTRAADSRPYGV